MKNSEQSFKQGGMARYACDGTPCEKFIDGICREINETGCCGKENCQKFEHETIADVYEELHKANEKIKEMKISLQSLIGYAEPLIIKDVAQQNEMFGEPLEGTNQIAGRLMKAKELIK